MVQWAGWYDYNHPEIFMSTADAYASGVCNQLAALPDGYRVTFLRGVLRTESYPAYGADPMFLFENGGVKLSRQIMTLRPLGRELRRRGMHLDGVWTDNEGALGFWNLDANTLAAILASPKARAKMPPAVRALRMDMFDVRSPNFRNAVNTFNSYAYGLMYRSLSMALVGSGIFCMPTTPGGPNVQPPTMNYMVSAPTWPVYDPNGWPWYPNTLDGRTSSPGIYLADGGRYTQPPRVHRWQWNVLIDAINHIRSVMHRPNSKIWPTIAWPNYTNAWVFEQMIAHWARTGVNWTAGGNAFIYWVDPPVVNRQVEDPLLVQIFSRHDQPFPVQRNLPEIPLDSDSITTAGFTTTYADFLANVQ
jgi:hypothetical protein